MAALRGRSLRLDSVSPYQKWRATLGIRRGFWTAPAERSGDGALAKARRLQAKTKRPDSARPLCALRKPCTAVATGKPKGSYGLGGGGGGAPGGGGPGLPASPVATLT